MGTVSPGEKLADIGQPETGGLLERYLRRHDEFPWVHSDTDDRRRFPLYQ